MKARDRAAIAGLLVLLVAIATALVMPNQAKPKASPTPAVSEVPYREGVLGHPSSVNPLTARSQADRDLVALLFRGLVKEGPDGTLLPDLAQSWTVGDDGRTYTFQMRDDAYWEDGFHVTADDVAYTIALLQDSRYDGPAGASWQGVRVTSVGVYTVKMTMSLANAGFLRLATQPIVPKHILQGTQITEMADSAYSARPIGDGPYRIVDIDYASALLQRVTSVVPPTTPGPTVAPTLSATATPTSTPTPTPTPTPAKTPTLKPGTTPSPPPTEPPTPAPTPTPEPTPSPTPPPTATPFIDLSGKVLSRIGEIQLVFYDDPESAAADFAAGKLDAVGGLPPGPTADAARTPGSRVVPYQWSSLLGIVVNQRPDHPETRDANARTGLLAAIDRARLIDTVLQGRGTATNLPLPAWSSAYDLAAAAEVPYSPGDATAYLDDAGWTLADGIWSVPGASPSAGYALELLTPDQSSNPIMYATAQFVADEWRAIGLIVRVDAVPVTTYLDRLDRGDFDSAVASLAIGLEPDLGPLLLSSQIGQGGSNVSGVQDPILDQMINAARKTVDPDQRKAALSTLERYLATTIPILPLAFREYDMVVSGHVQLLLSNEISDPSGRYWDVIDWRLANDR
jgi:ABC-type transport system substrate-binding protein